MLDEVAGREAFRLALDYLSDRSAFERCAQLERRDVAFDVPHPPAHVRVDRKPAVAHSDHPLAERRKIDLLQLEIVGGRKSFRAALEVPGAGHSCLLQGKLEIGWRRPQKRTRPQGDCAAGSWSSLLWGGSALYRLSDRCLRSCGSVSAGPSR